MPFDCEKGFEGYGPFLAIVAGADSPLALNRHAEHILTTRDLIALWGG
jgi:hypothetical protein